MEVVGALIAATGAAFAWRGAPQWRRGAASDSKTTESEHNRSRALDVRTLPGPPPEIDICFVHGLTGNAESTWATKDPRTGDDVFWPTSLPEQGLPQARILLYSYSTDASSIGWLTGRTLYHHARNLLAALADARKPCCDRPLLFVVHSLGGLLVKNALIFARNVATSSRTPSRQIYLSTFGVVSFGTPQTFAGNTPLEEAFERLGALILKLMAGSGASVYDGSSKLKVYVRQLQQRLEEYKPIAKRIPEVFCYESSRLGERGLASQKMAVPPRPDFVHPLSKAVSRMRDHHDLAKFVVPDRQLSEIVEYVKRFYEVYHPLMNERKSELSDMNTLSLIRESANMLRESTFRIDTQLPKNDNFVPRKDYFDIIKNRLHKDRLAVLTGTAGCGKTTLAREYANRQLKLEHPERPSSVFWIEAGNEQQLEASFMKIIVSFRSHYSKKEHRPSEDSPHAEVIHALRAVNLNNEGVPTKPHDRKFAVRAVLDWFDFPVNTDWLLVYDDVDSRHARYLRDFLPSGFSSDSQPTRGFIIMTSRSDHKKLARTATVRVPVDSFPSDAAADDMKRTDAEHDGRRKFQPPASRRNPTLRDLAEPTSTENRAHWLSSEPQSPILDEELVVSDPIEIGTLVEEGVVLATSQSNAQLGSTLSVTRAESISGDSKIIENLQNRIAANVAYVGDFASNVDFESVDDGHPRARDSFNQLPTKYMEWFAACFMLAREPIPYCLVCQNFGLSLDQLVSALRELRTEDWVYTADSSLQRKHPLETFTIEEIPYRLHRQTLEASVSRSKYANLACNAVINTIKQIPSQSSGYFKTLELEDILLKHKDACVEHLRDMSIQCEWDILADLCGKHRLDYDAARFYKAVRGMTFENSETDLLKGSTPSDADPDLTAEPILDDNISSKSAQEWNEASFLPALSTSHMSNKRHETNTSRSLRNELGLIRAQLNLGQLSDLGERCVSILEVIENRKEDRYLALRLETLQLLVTLKVALQEWSEAIECNRQLIELLECQFGPSSEETSIAIYDLAITHLKIGYYNDAESLLKRVYMNYEQTLGRTHLKTIDVLEKLAQVYMVNGKLDTGIECFEEVLAVTRSLFGEEHIRTAVAKANLADALDETGDRRGAKHLYESAMHAAKLLGTESDVYRQMKQRYEKRVGGIQDFENESVPR